MGASYPAYGALIPEGYEKSSDRQCAWKCPVRFCDSMFAEINQLGIHFVSYCFFRPRCNDWRTHGQCRNFTVTVSYTTIAMEPFQW